MKPYALALAACASLLAPALAAQPVLDINRTPVRTASSDPRELVRFDGGYYCTAEVDGARHLYRVTSAGVATRVLSELGSAALTNLTVSGDRLFFTYGRTLYALRRAPAVTPDAVANFYNSVPDELTDLQGTLYFIGQGLGDQPHLWRSDGTPAGTRLVSGAASDLRELTAAPNRLYFTAFTAATGRELWSSDGTTAGTAIVNDLYPGSTGSDPTGLLNYVANSVPNLNQIVCSVFHPQQGREPWLAQNLLMRTLGDIYPGFLGSFPSDFGLSSSFVLFAAEDATSGREPWMPCSVGISCRLADIRPGAGSSDPAEFTAVGSTTYFTADDGAGRALWHTDGTTGGTSRIGGGADPRHLTPFRTGVVFSSVTTQGREPAYWDGTRLTVLGLAPGDSNPDQFVVDDTAGVVVFAADHDSYGRELWIADGTFNGNRLLVDLNTAPGDAMTRGSFPQVGAALAGGTVFSADDGVHGPEPWWSDGTAAGTRLLRETVIGVNGGGAGEVTVAGDVAFFVANRSLWRTDATTAGTYARHLNCDPQYLTALGNRLFYSADTVLGRELYVAEGQSYLNVADIRLGSAGSDPQHMTALGNVMLLTADDGVVGRELWRTDGTPAGTARVADITGGSAGTTFHGMAALGDIVLVATQNGLWRSDGTGPGTRAIPSPVPLRGPHFLTPFGDRALFVATTTAHGNSMWSTDGSSITLVRGSGGGVDLFVPEAPVRLGDRLLFRRNSTELWHTDGTTAGTRLLYPFPGGLNPLVASGSRYAWFAGSDATTGRELWRTDGTTFGTGLVYDIAPGPTSSDPVVIGFAGPQLLLRAIDPLMGSELFVHYDGEATSRVVGQACAVATSPTLEVPDPVVASLLTIRGRFATPGAATFLLFSLAPLRGAPIPPPPAMHCVAWIDVGSTTALGPITANAAGAWQTPFPVPNETALFGLRLAWQAIVASASPLGYDLTPGVWTVVGR